MLQRVRYVFLDEQETHLWKGGSGDTNIAAVKGAWNNNNSRRPRICSTQREERLREKRKEIRDNRVRGWAQRLGDCVGGGGREGTRIGDAIIAALKTRVYGTTHLFHTERRKAERE